MLLLSVALAGAPARVPLDIPADGKYENVKIDGQTVPMINIMDGGATLLVDLDGKKPRTWEVQYKRVGDLPRGYFDTRKTDANHNNTFKDDAIDLRGVWKMDAKGNLTRD